MDFFDRHILSLISLSIQLNQVLDFFNRLVLPSIIDQVLSQLPLDLFQRGIQFIGHPRVIIKPSSQRQDRIILSLVPELFECQTALQRS